MEKTNKDYALDYLRRGMSVIPLDKKVALLNTWVEFQKRLPTEEEVNAWWTQHPDANIGIVTGGISKIVVVDVDGDEVPDFVDTPHCQTSPGRFHFYFAHPGFNVPNSSKTVAPSIDIRADGGYVAAPPSKHFNKVTGKLDGKYEWGLSLDDAPLAELPKWIVEKILFQKKPVNNTVHGSEEGSRNVDAASLIGLLLLRFPKYEWGDICWPLVIAWNDRNNPPLGLKELRTVFNSIASREDGKRSNLIHIPNAIEFSQLDFGDIDWVVDDLIPIGGRAIIVARRESYKTWLALYLAECITRGVPLWDRFNTHKLKVLYIANDDPQKNFQSRVKIFNLGSEFFVYHNALPKFTVEKTSDGFEAVKKLIADEGIGLVIVDIVRNTHDRDSNTDKDSKAVLEKFAELRESNPNLTFIFIIHPSKENTFERNYKKRNVEEAVGSYYWEAAVDTVISLIKQTEEDQSDVVQITVTKNKQSDKKFKPFIGITRKFNCPIEFTYGDFIPDKLKIQAAKDAIVQFLIDNGETQRKEIITFLDTNDICKSRIAEIALPELVKEKKIKHTKSRPYKYSLVEDETQTADIYKECDVAESKEVEQPQIFGEEDEA